MAGEKWYIYHEQDGKMVMQKSDHMPHLRQANMRAGKPAVKPIAATRQPLTPKEIAGYEEQYKLKFDPSPQPDLPPYEPNAPTIVTPTLRQLKAVEESTKSNG